MASQSYFLVWNEKLDDEEQIVFQWNSRVVPAELAFERLQKVLETAQKDRLKVVLIIKGHLGRDVHWESALFTHVKQATRQVFLRWFTQAVQAQAALTKQRVRRPLFD